MGIASLNPSYGAGALFNSASRGMAKVKRRITTNGYPPYAEPTPPALSAGPRGQANTSTRLRPPCLARYSASSARRARTVASSSAPSWAMPQLKVQARSAGLAG